MKRLIAVTLLSLIGCASTKIQYKPSPDVFALVNVTSEAKVKLCDPDNVCREVEDPIRWQGSGVSVHRKGKRSLIMSAAHVCDEITADGLLPPLLAMMGYRAEVLSQSLHVKVTDVHGNQVKATIAKKFAESDICFLHTSGGDFAQAKLADTAPQYGDRVWNIAAPTGAFAPGMVPLFDGYYVGDKTIEERNVSTYTLPVAPGSSGSPVLNEDGEVLGIISMGNMMLKHIAYASTLAETKQAYYVTLAELNAKGLL